MNTTTCQHIDSTLIETRGLGALGRCCPHCRRFLTEHNRAVWEAGYEVGERHARQGRP